MSLYDFQGSQNVKMDSDGVEVKNPVMEIQGSALVGRVQFSLAYPLSNVCT